MPCCESDKIKEGDVYQCEDCGLEVTVTKDCGCESCDLTCCGKPLKKKE